MNNGSPGLEPRAGKRWAFEVRSMPQHAGAPGVRTVTDDAKQVTSVRLQLCQMGISGLSLWERGASSAQQCRRRKRIPQSYRHMFLSHGDQRFFATYGGSVLFSSSLSDVSVFLQLGRRRCAEVKAWGEACLLLATLFCRAWKVSFLSLTAGSSKPTGLCNSAFVVGVVVRVPTV